MKISDLEALGLNRKAAQVYLSCLEIGSGTALQIGRKVNIPKSTTHDLLKDLLGQGLVSSYIKKNRKYYSASDPSIIGEKIKQRLQVFERILPELRATAYSGTGKPLVRYYDTKVGIEVAVHEIFTEAKELLFYGNVSAAFDAYPEYFPGYIEKRVQHKITSRGIVTPGTKVEEFMGNDKKTLRETRVIKTVKNVTSFAWVWNDKIAIFNTLGDHSVLIIEDKRIKNLFESMFEYMWSRTQYENKNSS